MSKYDKMDSNPHNESDVEIGQPPIQNPSHITNFGYHHQVAPMPPNPYPQHYQNPVYQPNVNILNSPGYMLVRAQTDFGNWAWYAKWISLVLMGVGSLIAILEFIGLIFVGNGKLVVIGPSIVREFDYPDGPLVFAQFVRIISWALVVAVGYKLHKTLQNPTRSATWKLFLIVLVIASIFMINLLVESISTALAVDDAYQQWAAIKRKPEGQYKFKDNILKSGKLSFIFAK